MYLSHVSYLTEELKKMDLKVEIERTDNETKLERVSEVVQAMGSRVEGCLTGVRDIETRVRLQEDKVSGVRSYVEGWCSDTDRYIALY